MDVFWFSIALLAQLSSSHGITWHTEPREVSACESDEVHLFWEYKLGGTDPSPPAIRWYKGNTTAGALIATYLFQQGTFHPNAPYDSQGKIDFNQTAVTMPDHDSATIVMTAIEATDLSQYSVVIQDVGDNTNAAIVGDLEFNDTMVVDGEDLTMEPDIHIDTINSTILTVTLVGCIDFLTANINISYTDSGTTTPTQRATCTDVIACTSDPVSSDGTITVTLEAVITQTNKAIDPVSFDMVPVFGKDTGPEMRVSPGDKVTIPWVYSWTPNNYTALRWMKDNQEIALYDFTNDTFEANDNGKLGFNTLQAKVDASLTIADCSAEDAGSYTVDLFGEYTSKPTVLIVDEEKDSGLSQAAKIGIGVGVSLGVIAIVLAIVLPLTVCQPKSKDSDHSDTGGKDSYDIEPRSQTNKL